MNYTPQISIIIPIYNTASTLETCIQSVLKQDFQDWEAILVDDGSSDNSYNQASDLSQKDSRIKVLQQEHQGVSTARNLALSKVQGKYVCFVDADDSIEPNYLSTMYKYRDFDMVVCGYYVDTYDKEKLLNRKEYTPDDIRINKITDKSILMNLFKSGMININCNKLLKAEMIQKNRLQYPHYPVNEDYIFMVNYLLHSQSICTITQPLYHWNRVFGQSTGVSSIPNNLLSIYNEAHLLTRRFFQDDFIADNIIYYSYYFIILKYLTNLSKKESTKKLKEFHKNALVKAAYDAHCSTNHGEKFLHWLQKKGYFRCYYLLYRILAKWKRQ